jgi:hypothetical protein
MVNQKPADLGIPIRFSLISSCFSGRSWKLCVDQLPGNANAVACLADATLQHVANVKLAANPFDVDSFAFVGKA